MSTVGIWKEVTFVGELKDVSPRDWRKKKGISGWGEGMNGR